MSYFRPFPLTTYTLGGKEYLATDILKRVAAVSTIQTVVGAFTEYDIKDGERPEMVAQKFYDSPTLHWIILLFNEIHDPFFDWPLSQFELQNYCEDVYGDDLYSVHHYERDGYVIGESKEYDKDNPDFVWTSPPNPGPQDPTVYPVSIFEYEEKLNDAKRSIKILRIELIPDFVAQTEVALGIR